MKSDIHRTSIQYTVLGKIHGKEVCLISPQDATLLLEDQLGKNLRKNLRPHNNVEGLGQLANHTCCDIHWNANLEVAAIEHEENTNIAPMAILRARCDTRKDTEILIRYWHLDKDAWQNIFDCQCCARTKHKLPETPNPTEVAHNTVTSTTEPPGQLSDKTP